MWGDLTNKSIRSASRLYALNSGADNLGGSEEGRCSLWVCEAVSVEVMMGLFVNVESGCIRGLLVAQRAKGFLPTESCPKNH